MHKYLRAIGFSGIQNRDRLQIIIAKTIKDAEERSFTTYDEDALLCEYSKLFADDIGLTVCGDMDDEDRFMYDYSYPFFKSDRISTSVPITVERHSDKISYAGVCDDSRLGITLIFYIQNRIEYIKNFKSNYLEGCSVILTGLSTDGIIVMPISKTGIDFKKELEKKETRYSLMEAAKKGDEDAIETLTLDDMDIYTSISRRIKTTDVYSIVESYFMPCGVECDKYSVMGEIVEVSECINEISKERIYKLSIIANEIPLDICINAADLYGEPKPGRRFKGSIWLQGRIVY